MLISELSTNYIYQVQFCILYQANHIPIALFCWRPALRLTIPSNDTFQTQNAFKRFGTFSLCHSFSARLFHCLWWVVNFSFVALVVCVCNFIANKLHVLNDVHQQRPTCAISSMHRFVNRWLHADYIVSWNRIKIAWCYVRAQIYQLATNELSLYVHGSAPSYITISFPIVLRSIYSQCNMLSFFSISNRCRFFSWQNNNNSEVASQNCSELDIILCFFLSNAGFKRYRSHQIYYLCCL